MPKTSRPVRTRLAAVVVALLALVTVGLATATPAAAAACDEQFTVLRTDTSTVAIIGGKVDKERAGLLKVIEDASTLAEVGKTTDAVTKLSEFVVKVQQLQSAGRISDADAQRLIGEAQAVTTCATV